MVVSNNKGLIAGNWKMNGLRSQLDQISELAGLVTVDMAQKTDVALCVPDTLLFSAAEATKNSALKIGAQDCHVAASGAYTGDSSAQMVVDAGAAYVIVGHSERRDVYKESDSLVAEKASVAYAAGADPIICIGESLAQREAGETLDVIAVQLAGSVPDVDDASRLVVAYEPIWAIGTGLTANVEQIGEVHASIRKGLVERFGDAGAKVRILYGGSMKAANAEEILAVQDVDGGLVGGASLTNEGFLPIIQAAAKA